MTLVGNSFVILGPWDPLGHKLKIYFKSLSLDPHFTRDPMLDL